MKVLKNENIEMRAEIKRLESIAEEQKLVIEEKTKKESIEKKTQECKANEFQTVKS